MSCNNAKFNDEGRYNCRVSGDECIYLIPNKERCYKDGFINKEDKKDMNIKEVEYDNIQCYGNSEAVCPYCGCKNYVETESYGDQDDETVEECGSCGKYYVHTIDYSITFSSEPYENYYIRKRKHLEKQHKRYELNIKENHNVEYYKMLLNNTQKEILELDREAREILEAN